MAVYDNMLQTTTAGLRHSTIEEYIERTLLENLMPAMPHSMDAQIRKLPQHAGTKHIKFRKFNPMPVITTPLAEGVTPDGDSLSMTAFTAMPKPYGNYISMTDELNYYMIDDMTKEAAKLLRDQAALSLDTISRDALHTGMNVQYAGGKASRAALTSTDVISYAEIKKVVRTLKNNLCKPYGDGYYHAIVHPNVVHDLTSDPMWVDIAKYQDKQRVAENELGIIYKVKFFESTNAKVYTTPAKLIGTNKNGIAELTNLAVTDFVADTRTGKFTANLTEDQARAITGQMVSVTVDSTVIPMCIERVDVINKTIRFRWAPSGVGTSFTVAPYGTGSIDVYGTLISGQNAYGSVELEGGGKNIEVIVKEPGSSGSLDPLNQRGTIGWKVKGFGTFILQDDFLVRLETAASA